MIWLIGIVAYFGLAIIAGIVIGKVANSKDGGITPGMMDDLIVDIYNYQNAGK